MSIGFDLFFSWNEADESVIAAVRCGEWSCRGLLVFTVSSGTISFLILLVLPTRHLFGHLDQDEFCELPALRGGG